MKNALNTLSFTEAEGEMAQLIREYDWSKTALGSIDTWNDNFRSKLNTIINSAFPMFLFWGDELTCFYNDAFRPILGNNGRHPSVGQKASSTWSESWHTLGEIIRNVLKTGKPEWFEDKLLPIHRNGKIEDVYFTFSCSALSDENNLIAGVVMICMETTDKVNIFKQLQESNNLYSFAIDASELGTWDLNPATNKFKGNARLKEWFGLEPEDEIDLSRAIDVVAEKDRSRLSDAIAHALQYESGGAFDIEYSIINPKTGQERIVKAKGKAAFNENKESIRLNGTLQDITAEVIARDKSRKLSILVENSVDLMAILNMEGKNDYINKAGKDLLGIDEDADVTAIPIADFHTPEQLAFVTSEIVPNVMSKGKWSGQFAVKNALTGEIIPLYNNSHRIDDERTGKTIGIGTVMRDMRSELNARQKLEELVQERTKELMKLNEELERKNKDLASFAFISSHDLQEPLRKICTFVSRIEEDNSLSERNQVYFGKVRSSANRMQTLIKDILAFSKTGKEDEKFETCDLNEVIAELEKENQEILERSGTLISYTDLPNVNAVPFQLQQVFSNLLINSIKFAEKDRPLQVIISSEIVNELEGNFSKEKNRFNKIRFSDNGIGFDPKYKDRIFEVFQRLHSKDQYEGTGIGLSICKRIMENSGGFMTAESEPGKGATFYLYFPLINLKT